MVMAGRQSQRTRPRTDSMRRSRRFKGNRGELLQVKGRINSVVNFGTVDGPGVRYVLFLQGCPLRCLYCHNPDSVCSGGGLGVWTAGETLSKILRYRRFIQNGGVTFSGGEPLAQPAFVKAMVELLRQEGLHTAIDTSGAVPPDTVAEVIDAADMLLLDIKAIDPQTSIKLTGMDNQNALATLEHCEKTGKPVWIRHVLLRGYTLEDGQLARLAEYLKPFKCMKNVELLPFHQWGAEKWEKIGRTYALAGVEPTTPEETQHAKDIFLAHGIQAH